MEAPLEEGDSDTRPRPPIGLAASNGKKGNMINILVQIFDRALDLLAACGAFVILFITGVVCWDVSSRFLFGFGPHWSLEVTEYGLLWFTMLAGAWVLKKERHVNVDIMLVFFSPRRRALFGVITSLVAGIACIIIFATSVFLVWTYYQNGERLSTMVRPPKYIPYIIIPIGFFFLSIQFMRRSYHYFIRFKSQK